MDTGFKFDLDMGLLGADADFDLSDFSILAEGETGVQGVPQEHILKPRIAAKDITHKLCYDNAQAFADQVELRRGARTYAWVNGNFVFGDLIEALWEHRRCDIRELYICSLSLSRNNIDSLANLLMFSRIERLYLVLSGYFYTNEKHGLIDYMYKRLDDPRTQIAFGAYHGKIFSFKTARGFTVTCHGSANLRSSNSIEQICLECSPELHNWNAAIIRNICDDFGTLNHAAGNRLGVADSWNAVTTAAAEAERIDEQ